MAISKSALTTTSEQASYGRILSAKLLEGTILGESLRPMYQAKIMMRFVLELSGQGLQGCCRSKNVVLMHDEKVTSNGRSAACPLE